MRLPGTRLLAVARLIIDPTAVTRVLEPLVADWQREWLMSETRLCRAVVRVKGLAAFAGSAAYCWVAEDVPRALRTRSWTTLSTFVTLGILAQSVVLFAVDPSQIGWWLPALLTISVPFAILPVAMRANSYGDRGRRHLVRVALATMLVVFVLHNWVTPYANQMWRERAIAIEAAARGRTPPVPVRRGLRELTFTELIGIDRVEHRLSASPRQISEEVQNRLTLPLIPLLLAMLGWSLTRIIGSAGHLRVTFWWVFIAATFGVARSLGMTIERWWHLPRDIAVWLPLVLWALTSVALIGMARRRPHLDNRSQPVQ